MSVCAVLLSGSVSLSMLFAALASYLSFYPIMLIVPITMIHCDVWWSRLSYPVSDWTHMCARSVGSQESQVSVQYWEAACLLSCGVWCFCGSHTLLLDLGNFSMLFMDSCANNVGWLVNSIYYLPSLQSLSSWPHAKSRTVLVFLHAGVQPLPRILPLDLSDQCVYILHPSDSETKVGTISPRTTCRYLGSIILICRNHPTFLLYALCFLISIFKSFPTVGDVALPLALLPLWSHLFKCKPDEVSMIQALQNTCNFRILVSLQICDILFWRAACYWQQL